MLIFISISTISPLQRVGAGDISSFTRLYPRIPETGRVILYDVPAAR